MIERGRIRRGCTTGGLRVHEVVQDNAVEDRFQPNLHGSGEGAGNGPPHPPLGPVLDHVEVEVGKPATPAGPVPHCSADRRRIGGDERLVSDLNAAHVV